MTLRSPSDGKVSYRVACFAGSRVRFASELNRRAAATAAAEVRADLVDREGEEDKIAVLEVLFGRSRSQDEQLSREFRGEGFERLGAREVSRRKPRRTADRNSQRQPRRFRRPRDKRITYLLCSQTRPSVAPASRHSCGMTSSPI